MKHALLFAALFAGLVVATGCSGQPSHYYVYSAPAASEEDDRKTLMELNAKGAAGYELTEQKPFMLNGQQGTIYVLRRRPL